NALCIEISPSVLTHLVLPVAVEPTPVAIRRRQDENGHTILRRCLVIIDRSEANVVQACLVEAVRTVIRYDVRHGISRRDIWTRCTIVPIPRECQIVSPRIARRAAELGWRREEGRDAVDHRRAGPIDLRGWRNILDRNGHR